MFSWWLPEQSRHTWLKVAVQRLRLQCCLSHVGASNGDVAGQKNQWTVSDGVQNSLTVVRADFWVAGMRIRKWRPKILENPVSVENNNWY